MKSNSNKYNRQSIRLKGYDYSQPGYYFVTICTQASQILFGDVNQDAVKLNSVGQMVDWEWNQIPNRYSYVNLNEHIIMPNHFHGILQITDDLHEPANQPHVGTSLVGVLPAAAADRNKIDNKKTNDVMQSRTGTRPVPTATLSNIIGAFKSITTNNYIRNVKQNNWPAFIKRVWQQRFYERIIRDENELNRIQKYIIENPINWAVDDNNPENLIK